MTELSPSGAVAVLHPLRHGRLIHEHDWLERPHPIWEGSMGYTELIACLRRIESASLAYRKGPPSSETHGAMKQALSEGYLVLVMQERNDPIIDGARPHFLRVCRSILHALDFGVMELAPNAPSRYMAREYCLELSLLTRRLMPYLTSVEVKQSQAIATLVEEHPMH